MTFTVYPEGDKKSKYQVSAKEGENLLDALNDMNIKDIKQGIPSKYDKNNSYNVIIFLGKDYKDFGETK